MSKYSQLILFDCDGGRSTLFSDKTILYDLPSNCECYLFWNKDSKTVTDNLDELRDISQIHLCPSHLKNSKNSADGKLIYFLGKFVERFDFILIVHGNDNIYNEIVETVRYDYNQQKIDQKRIYRPTNQVLSDLFVQLQNNAQHNYVDPKPLIELSDRELVNIDKKSCLKCTKTFKTILSLYHHVKGKHKQSVLLICACSFECTTIREFNRHQKMKKQQIIDRQGVVRCLFTAESSQAFLNSQSPPIVLSTGKTNRCSFGCCWRYFDPPGLFTHLSVKHGNDIDIRVQCCNPHNQYTLVEFRKHIGSQHTIVKLQ